MKKLLVLTVCLIATVMLSACNLPFSNSGQPEIELEAKAIKLANEAIRGDYKLVSTPELKKWMDSNKDLLIIDTMPYEASYKKNHIPGAVQILFPIPDMKEWNNAETNGKSMEDFAALLGENKDRTLVFYCGFVKCTRSHNGAMWARKLGYTNVYRQPGGIKGWKQAGFAAESVK